MTENTVTVIAAYVTRYDEVIVEVERYVDEVNGYRVEVEKFVGDAGDRGDYLVGRSTMIRKDGTLGVRTILLDSRHTPAAVRAAARALFS